MSPRWVGFFVGAIVWVPIGIFLMALLVAGWRARCEHEGYMRGLEKGKAIGRKSVWNEAASLLRTKYEPRDVA